MNSNSSFTTMVFVYGSLKKGFGNHGRLEHGKAEFVGEEITEPKFTMRASKWASYPAVHEDGETPIIGEVYRVDDNTLASLDVLEGHPNFYKRVRIETKYGKAWIYVMARKDWNTDPVIHSGFWEKPDFA